jgi:hypothetical protein
MPFDAAVRDVRVKEIARFDRNMQPVTEYVYTFWVSDHGPFTQRFGAGEHFPDAVTRRINEFVLKLRETGVLTPAGG